MFESSVEVQGRACGFRRVQQQDVQIAATDRPDHLAIVFSVAQQLLMAIGEMHHAATHHHRLLQYVIVDTRGAQCIEAAFGKREIDRTPTGIAMHARVAAALE